MAQSLRDRQKVRRREDMLVAARTLFVEKGYSRTTMDAIAEQADVGVATVYTYFGSKEGVFAELARMDMSELKAAGEAALEALPAEPVAALWELLGIYRRVLEFITYDVVRDFTLGARTRGRIREVAGWVRDWQSDQLARALEQGIDAGSVAPTLDTAEAAQIVCDLFERYQDRATSDAQEQKAFEMLTRRVALLFESWRP